ncbi:clan AA aspartic protease [Alteromonas pelagimontana]|uniref:Clan AA aspartic protease n=1 Tax=Alteromonas pelagimontana TaxID=1858656 RepID=A0A6M4MGX7_9ALTE|nr:retropepsin-like aspartic protease [Alteromonas pelagimontana]QJR82217.1 clan AA aspartic protease [Alteromonas pelagimontana]
MKTAVAVLSLLLIISLSLNVWYWSSNHKAASAVPDSATAAPATPVRSANINISAVAPDSPPGPENTAAEDKSEDAQELSRIKSWIRNGEFAQAATAINERLRLTPDDIELLLLEADIIAKTQPLSDAIIHYYSLLDLSLPPSTRGDIENRISTLMQNAIEQLKKDRAWDLLARFLEPLFQLMPQDRSIIVALADAYARQNKLTLMEDVLASLPPNDYQASAIRKRVQDETELPSATGDTDSAPPANAKPDAVTQIPLTRAGDHFIVEVKVTDLPVPLLIDTGASTTAVSSQLFADIKNRAHVDFVGVFDVNTAAGKIRAPLVQLSSLEIGPYRLKDVSVLVLPVDAISGAQGLLGMNILKQFDFRIDQQGKILMLRPL